MNDVLNVLILGIIEGITEFLPISSTGHLILFNNILHVSNNIGPIFDIVIQIGAILAVCYCYSHLFFKIAKDSIIEKNKIKKKQAHRFIFLIATSFLPALVFGMLLHHFIEKNLFSVKVVANSMIIGGMAIIIIEKLSIKIKHHTIEDFSYFTALKIGLCQVLAMVPGVSRSGATIMGAICLGVDRKTATEYSFFLAIPTIIGAGLYSLYKNIHNIVFDDLLLIFFGSIVSFISALLVVKLLLRFISKHDFTVFGYYRIIAGIIILACIHFGML